MFKNILKSLWLPAILIFTLFGLAACSGASANNATPTPVDVTVTLTDFKIDSSITTFKVGVPYHFTITNNGSVNHEFDVMPPMSDPVSPETVLADSVAHVNQDQLNPGATATLDYTFTKAYPAGTLEFACHLPGHYEAGMHTGIVVTQ
jgi:uncharacterized cupredoxin-like copper-binding protein